MRTRRCSLVFGTPSSLAVSSAVANVESSTIVIFVLSFCDTLPRKLGGKFIFMIPLSPGAAAFGLKAAVFDFALPPQFPLTYRNPSPNMSLVRIYALTAGALSRFFFSELRSSPRREASPAHTAPGQHATGKGASFAHELCLLLTPFRINTCKSVSKQSTLTIFRMNTYEKHREGGCEVGADRAHP